MFRMRSAALCIAMALATTGALAQTTTEPLPTPTVSAGSVTDSKLTVIVRTDLSATADPTYVNPAVSYYEVTTNSLGLVRTLRLDPGQTTYSLDLASGTTIPANTPVEVTAKSVSSTGAKSAASAPLIANTAPAAPSGVTGISGKNRVTVSWKPSEGAAKYMVTLSNGMSYTTASTSQVFSGLPTATTYNAVVWAFNAAGVRSASSPVVKVSTAKIMLN